ncbi:NfeD family protein [Vibrio sp. YMD68]|uniref:NfeD family protein n=1 Tax=Vibrio sp. YMD68 TaxID=3042300 RepID=UPI00249BA532|nr:NfeD family protein [Vibrio sp. YMD68]WGW01122.1 NfeD family protein [Vibrio sp. YMD68]
MLEFLDSINHWHWLAFGLALLAMELLGTAGYFLWLGISALIVGVILSSLPMSWQLQWVSFGVFSLITTWLWWRKQIKNDTQDDKNRDLNQKQKQLVGKILTVSEDLPAGSCRLKVGDSTWKAETSQAISSGQTIKIIGVDGITLKVEVV